MFNGQEIKIWRGFYLHYGFPRIKKEINISSEIVTKDVSFLIVIPEILDI